MSVIANIGGGSSTIRGNVRAAALPYYVGDYTVTPRLNEQVTLQTAQRAMSANVVVEQIPLYETENLQGGKTVIIG